MFAVDNKVSDNEYVNLPDGYYKMVIIECKVVTDDKGSRFEFTYVVDEGKYQKRRAWGRHVFQGVATTKPKTLENNLSLLKDLFWIAGKNGFKTMQEAQEIASDFVGIELYVNLKSNEWQGKTFQNPEHYYKADGTPRPTEPKRKPLDLASLAQPAATSSSTFCDPDVPF